VKSPAIRHFFQMPDDAFCRHGHKYAIAFDRQSWNDSDSHLVVTPYNNTAGSRRGFGVVVPRAAWLRVR
jgi:hypothetical protein